MNRGMKVAVGDGGAPPGIPGPVRGGRFCSLEELGVTDGLRGQVGGCRSAEGEIGGNGGISLGLSGSGCRLDGPISASGTLIGEYGE